MVKSKYELLNNKEWLYNKYIVEKKGTIEITKLAGAKTPNSARQALIKFGIPLRSIGEGLTCDREDEGFVLDDMSRQVIEGSLLGDASLRVWQKGNKNANTAVYKTNKYYDHILYFTTGIFRSFEKAKEKIVERNNYLEYKGVKRSFSYFHVNTYSYKELNTFYERWYPESSGFKKVVPKDIVITPIVLLHWFMDDGCSILRKRDYKENPNKKWLSRRRKENQVFIIFCSESFTREDQEMLVEQMNKKFNLEAKVIACGFGTGWRIKITQSQTQNFFKLIGPCPVPSLAYKWKVYE